jgi:hypothetical protein
MVFQFIVGHKKGFTMKNSNKIITSGFLFVGGAVLMLVTEFGKTVPIFGLVCSLVGVGMLLYFTFSKDGSGKY